MTRLHYPGRSNIPRFIQWGVLFLCGGDCVALALYGVGTRQGFSDAAQLAFLGIALRVSQSLFLLAACGACLSFRRLFRRNRRGTARRGAARRGFAFELARYALFGGFGAAAAVFAAGMLVIAGGSG